MPSVPAAAHQAAAAAEAAAAAAELDVLRTSFQAPAARWAPPASAAARARVPSSPPPAAACRRCPPQQPAGQQQQEQEERQQQDRASAQAGRHGAFCKDARQAGRPAGVATHMNACSADAGKRAMRRWANTPYARTPCLPVLWPVNSTHLQPVGQCYAARGFAALARHHPHAGFPLLGRRSARLRLERLPAEALPAAQHQPFPQQQLAAEDPTLHLQPLWQVIQLAEAAAKVRPQQQQQWSGRLEGCCGGGPMRRDGCRPATGRVAHGRRRARCQAEACATGTPHMLEQREKSPGAAQVLRCYPLALHLCFTVVVAFFACRPFKIHRARRQDDAQPVSPPHDPTPRKTCTASTQHS